MTSFEFYQQRAAQFLNEAGVIEKIIRKYSWSRVALVLIGAALLYFGFDNSTLFYFLPLVILLFFYLVKRQFKYEEQKQVLQNLAKLNDRESKAVNFQYDEFPEGEEFVDPHHSFSYDLDLFGKGSLYQYLNRCATQSGDERLAHDLTQLNFSKEEIKQRQDAARELAPLIELRQQAWAIGRQINDFSFNHKPLLHWLTESPFIYGKIVFTIVKWLLPAIAIGFIVLTIMDWSYYIFVLTMMGVQLTIASSQFKKVTRIQKILTEGRSILANYSRLFDLLDQQNFTSSLMKKHHALSNEAAREVKQFSNLVNSLESRMNPIAMQFGNGLFMFDFHAVSKLEAWREKNAKALPLWLESLAEWDALISLATLHYNHPEYAFGETSDQLVLKGKGVGHPLIPTASRVANDLNLGDPAGIMLITGANMAGKSTFLRTIGVNFVLAQIGSPVCATQWSNPMVTLRSGMRTSDSLQDHQSYFFAELYRLKSIMEELREGKQMLILLDEILKGTNSTDKQLGSRELLKQLKEYNALVLLATHDIALGDLETLYPKQIINTCFEGKIEEGSLSFDYTLHYGVAQKANATFLMRQMGIIKGDG